MNLSLGTQWAKATDLTPYEAHNDIYSICTYLYEYEFIPMILNTVAIRKFIPEYLLKYPPSETENVYLPLPIY